MIKKINKINYFAVFNNFDWDTTVRDKGNNIGEFKKLNILYGRNYSGKTTLSRIFRCFEMREMHEKYITCQFELLHTENGLLNQQKLTNQSFHVRVYNKDFVKDNLKWLIDEQGHIEPFAIIGAKNIEIEDQIKEKEDLLGSEEEQKGIRYEFSLKNEQYENTRKKRNNLKNSLDDKLREKANNDIKRNSIYNNVTYNIVSIKTDIVNINKNVRPLLKEQQVNSLKDLLREEPKSTIIPLIVFYPRFKTILETSENLLGKVIKPSIPIQELLNDAVLALWVRDGIEHHRGKRKICGFCGQQLPEDLWNKLDAHFSKESEDLREAIAKHILYIEQEKQKINNLILINKNQLYSANKISFEEKEEEWKEGVKEYFRNLDKLITELNARVKDIFNARRLSEIEDTSKVLEGLQQDFNALVEVNNKNTDTLKTDQERARTDLRLNEIGEFINAIDYNEKVAEIDKLIIEENNLLEIKNKLSLSIINIAKDIEQLQIKLKDEKKGADKVNEYLNHYFGHDGLRLVAKEEGASYKFNIQRGDEIAHNLSEGEQSLVAFCYFMARLEDTESEGKELIIWIDDPVSSLDSNHVFFVFSLIENILAKPHKYKQLFISTHNLEFLKYLRRLTTIKKETEYFIVEGSKKNSRIIIMPDYLKKYITEFNYLFHQIYKCATVTTPEAEHDIFYNFTNNLRKFLEAYLFYKYPVERNVKDKLNAFFCDDKLSVDLVDRLDNEYSHLEEIFDRSMKPIEIPEIPKLAKFVLEKIKNKDKDQFNALLESIGAEYPN